MICFEKRFKFFNELKPLINTKLFVHFKLIKSSIYAILCNFNTFQRKQNTKHLENKLKKKFPGKIKEAHNR